MIVSSYPSQYMNLWLKAEGYSVVQINQLPTVIYAITIVASWLGTTVAAIYPNWAIYTIVSVCCVFSTLCMTIWNIPTGLKVSLHAIIPFRFLLHAWVEDKGTDLFRFFAWCLFGVAGCSSPILYSTVNTIVKDDSEERALIMVCSPTALSTFSR